MFSTLILYNFLVVPLYIDLALAVILVTLLCTDAQVVLAGETEQRTHLVSILADKSSTWRMNRRDPRNGHPGSLDSKFGPVWMLNTASGEFLMEVKRYVEIINMALCRNPNAPVPLGLAGTHLA
jgi:hypothetical protein